MALLKATTRDRIAVPLYWLSDLFMWLGDLISGDDEEERYGLYERYE